MTKEKEVVVNEISIICPIIIKLFILIKLIIII